MSRLNDDVVSGVYAIAEQAVQQYAQGILSVSTLAMQIYREAEEQEGCENTPLQKVLKRAAQRICSRALYKAWCNSDSEIRNRAFDNLRRYLEWSLLHSSYAHSLQMYANALEDVLHQTLEVLSTLATKKPCAGPDDPATFLKWTQTILIRQARVSLERYKHDTCVSLEEQAELFAEQFVDTRNGDPLDEVLLQEVQKTVVAALLSLRNPRYRQVLVASYVMGLEEQEVAQQLGVEVQDVYLWRHRALKALRRQSEVIRVLRALHE